MFHRKSLAKDKATLRHVRELIYVNALRHEIIRRNL